MSAVASFNNAQKGSVQEKQVPRGGASVAIEEEQPIASSAEERVRQRARHIYAKLRVSDLDGQFAY